MIEAISTKIIERDITVLISDLQRSLTARDLKDSAFDFYAKVVKMVSPAHKLSDSILRMTH